MSDFIIEKANILVVDDENINRMLARKILSPMYDIADASSGEDAFVKIAQRRPDLILLDVHMTGMDGHEVLRRLKNDEATKDIPVIFLTADTDLDAEANGLKEGASDFIFKPFRANTLIQRVSHTIELNFLQKNLKEEINKQTKEIQEKSKRIEQMSLQTVQTLANAIDAKDSYTDGHSTRVSQYSMLLAETLGWDNERIDNLRYAALLHDIGKIGVPDAIINNPNKLKDTEYEIIKNHTTIGGDILKNVVLIEGAEEVATHHHEKYDGTGYPSGQKGENISIESRIVALADAYDAMNSNRVYRKALDVEKIKQEIVAGKGTQFDPDLADKFLQLMESDAFDIVAKRYDQTTDDSIEATSALLQKVMESFVSASSADDIDVISGLKTRKAGEREIAAAMQEGKGCFAFFDVDNLKKINDTIGHKAGDKVLKLMGSTMKLFEEDSIPCRLGGDEFLFFMKGLDREEAEFKINKIVDAFMKEKQKDSELLAASLSVGAVMCTPSDTYIDVYNKADKALYHVKQNGKADVSFYQEDSDKNSVGTLDLEKLILSIKNSGRYDGAMDVDYREFTKLFEYIGSLKARYDHEFNLVLITLNTPQDRTVFIDEIEKAMQCMEQSIRQTIRKVDIVTRYSSVQFLTILMEADESGVKTVIDRIFQGYYKLYGGNYFEPTYAVADLSDSYQNRWKKCE